MLASPRPDPELLESMGADSRTIGSVDPDTRRAEGLSEHDGLDRREQIIGRVLEHEPRCAGTERRARDPFVAPGSDENHLGFRSLRQQGFELDDPTLRCPIRR